MWQHLLFKKKCETGPKMDLIIRYIRFSCYLASEWSYWLCNFWILVQSCRDPKLKRRRVGAKLRDWRQPFFQAWGKNRIWCILPLLSSSFEINHGLPWALRGVSHLMWFSSLSQNQRAHLTNGPSDKLVVTACVFSRVNISPMCKNTEWFHHF